MMNRILRDIGLLVGLTLTVACARLPKEGTYGFRPSPDLAAIDSLMWRQPDSAFAQLLQFADTADVDSLDAFDRHYFQLLVAELLYKNDYAQSNRTELKQAVAYYDSLNSTLADNSRSTFPHRNPALRHPRSIFPHCGLDPQSPSLYGLIPFLSARTHYINGVGYYENDSAVEACAEYLKALEVMEKRFEEKELVGKRAQFMAYTYNRLGDLFSDQFMMEPSIACYDKYFLYCNIEPTSIYGISKTMLHIGIQYDMKGEKNQAMDYYKQAMNSLPDTNNLIYRDIVSIMALCNYQLRLEIEQSLNTMKKMVSSAKTESERLTRYYTIGDMYYEEGLYDSALYYLEPVFEGSQDVVSKAQAANFLRFIYDSIGDKKKSDECLRYLAVCNSSGAENKALVSRLENLFETYMHQKQETKAAEEREKSVRKVVGIIIPIAIGITLAIVVILRLKSTKKLKARQEEMEIERQSHSMKQAALSGRLKRSNQELRELKEQIKQQNESPTKSESVALFTDEPVCRHILSVCNDKNNPIKSTVPVSAYAGIALTYAQKAELKEAALRHYGHLFERLRQQYPELKEKDFFYCYLCLLELDNVQISALMQKSISTIWDRESRLKRIFGSEDKVSVVLHGLMNN